MTRLPRGVPAKRVIRALQRKGFYIRRHRGSHVIMRRDNPWAQVVVPMHASLDTGTLDVILEGAGLTTEEFMELM